MSSEAGLTTIEQVAKTPDDYCQARNRPFLIGVNTAIKRAVFFQPRCRSWSCPHCAKVNRALWAARAFHGAQHLNETLSKPIAFLTLTSHEKLDRAGSLAVWPKAWSNLRKRAHYQSGGFDYLLVPEQHEDGRLHVHAIETAALGERFWKDNARAVGLGYMVDEEIARTPQGAAFYVVKYLTKSIGDTLWPRGFRRVRTSRHWPKLPQMEQPSGWDFKPLAQDKALADEVQRWQDAGYYVELLNHAQAWVFIEDSTPE